jgi:hypothetical protein
MKNIFSRQLTGPFIFLLFGLLFFAIGSGLTYRQRTFEKQGIETQGVVVGLQESTDSDGSTYAPIVNFKASSGQSVEFVTSYYSSPPSYEVGQTVTVVYSPEKPEKAVIKGDGQLFHIIFMLVGGVIVAVGAYLVYSSLRDLSFSSQEG